MENEQQRRAGERLFLSAEWRDLVMVNYAVDPDLLRKYVPRGTELDSFDGRTFVSLVGFRFLRTKLLGFLPLPFHANFDEVNLRFYVRHRAGAEERRGVVFIREIVPRRAVAAVARAAFGENYSSHPMRHLLRMNGARQEAEFRWKLKSGWCRLYAKASAEADFAKEGSLEQFITEHYWGYTARRGGDTLEYHVTHPAWRVWKADIAGFQGEAESLYGTELADALLQKPDSAFIGEGSPVMVFAGKVI